MPLHRHECEACGNRFRVLVLPGAENETPACPVCGSTASHRLMPLVAVQFKGSGYYKTDYKRGGRSRSDRGGSEAGSGDPVQTKPPGDSEPSSASGGSSKATSGE